MHAGGRETYDRANEIPDVMRMRVLSLRGFDAAGMMIDADIVEGVAIETLIAWLFAKRGCYAARIDRLARDAQSPAARTHAPPVAQR